MRSISGHVALAAALCATPSPAQEASTGPRTVHLGVVTDGPAPRSDLYADSLRREIRALLEGEFVVEEVLLEGDWTTATVEAHLDALLADPQIDVVLAAGLTASSAAVRRRDVPRPLIAPFVVDAEVQAAPFDHGASGVENLVYVTFAPTVEEDLELLRELASVDDVAFLHQALPAETVDVVERKIRETAEGIGMRVSMIEIPADPAEALSRVPADADAVFLLPLLHMTEPQIGELARGFIERRLPSFTATPGEVELGILASVTEGDNLTRLARRVAILVQRILLGEDAGTLPVLFERHRRLSLNVETARAIGIHPSFAIEADARLVGERSGATARPLRLAEAVYEAVDANRDLAALEQSVAARREDVRVARAARLPQLDVSATGIAIDGDRGSVFQAQRSLEAGVGLRQLVYSDAVWSDVEIRERLLEGSREELEALRLDVIRASATAYLNVLQAETLERITKQNLQLTRENLERARTRVQIGVANRSEVLRWQSQLANNRRDVIEAAARRNVAEIELNRIRNRPLEEPFATVEVGLEDPGLASSDERILRYLRNRHVFRLFRAFNVLEAVRNSPELRQLDAAIAAAERGLVQARRSFYVPEIGLEARVDKRLHEGGAGADDPRGFDDLDWQIGVQASLPLFAGGARAAARARAELELEELRERRRAAVLRVDQRLRSTMHLAGASMAGIDLARQAAAAARESLELVSDSYARGVVSIIELLDAQNQAFVAELSAANALYQFLLDLMEVERAVGRFDFFTTAEEREAYIGRLEAYRAAQEAGEQEDSP